MSFTPPLKERKGNRKAHLSYRWFRYRCGSDLHCLGCKCLLEETMAEVLREECRKLSSSQQIPQELCPGAPARRVNTISSIIHGSRHKGGGLNVFVLQIGLIFEDCKRACVTRLASCWYLRLQRTMFPLNYISSDPILW